MTRNTHSQAVGPSWSRRTRSVLVCWVALLAVSCASPVLAPSQVSGYRYFAPAPVDDMWSPKIAAWQAREQAHLERARGDLGLAPVSGAGPLGGGRSGDTLKEHYRKLRREMLDRPAVGDRRKVARDAARWIQERAIDHYIPDGPIDHWATLEETLARNGDDCDGLELLTFHLLRDLSFGDDRVYRAIVVRPSDGQHHMVTLWFEDPKDPWVLDPTGAMTLGMPRMSQRPAWAPLKVFGLERDFTVQPKPKQRSADHS